MRRGALGAEHRPGHQLAPAKPYIELVLFEFTKRRKMFPPLIQARSNQRGSEGGSDGPSGSVLSS
jgi:hypothetical protein